VAADPEACVQPPLGESIQRVTTPKEDAQITGETKRMSDADDEGCEDDCGGKSSNIVTHIRRKP